MLARGLLAWLLTVAPLVLQNLNLIFPRDEDWHLGWKNYQAIDTNRAGIVDQISFVVMRRLGITKAFTNDQHFRTAGFETLF